MAEKLKVGDIAFLDDRSGIKSTGNHRLTAVEIVGYRVSPENAYILKELTNDHNINGAFNDVYWEHTKREKTPLLSAKDTVVTITKGVYTKFGNESFVALAVLQTELGFQNIKDRGLDTIVKSVSNSIKQETQRLSEKSEAMRKWNEGAVFQTKEKIAKKLQRRRDNRDNRER